MFTGITAVHRGQLRQGESAATPARATPRTHPATEDASRRQGAQPSPAETTELTTILIIFFIIVVTAKGSESTARPVPVGVSRILCVCLNPDRAPLKEVLGGQYNYREGGRQVLRQGAKGRWRSRSCQCSKDPCAQNVSGGRTYPSPKYRW